jgi:hypothetical protein
MAIGSFLVLLEYCQNRNIELTEINARLEIL